MDENALPLRKHNVGRNRHSKIGGTQYHDGSMFASPNAGCLEREDSVVIDNSWQDNLQNESQENIELRHSLKSQGLEERKIEFIIDQGRRYLEKPLILSKKLKISLAKAEMVINILKYSRLDRGLVLTEEDYDKIEECLRENPEIYSHEDIALLCEIDEELVSAFFDMKPLTENEKKLIEEHYNKDIPTEIIANILKIPSKNVEEYIEKTLMTFTGEEGRSVLEIIYRNFGETPIPILREKIRSKDLKLQNQLCCTLTKSPLELMTVMSYLSKYKESEDFLKIDISLDISDILTIKKSQTETVEQLSSKLNKVESIIINYQHIYVVLPNERLHYKRLQTIALDKIRSSLGNIKISFDQYRMIITRTFEDIVNKIDKKLDQSKKLIIGLFPMAFYYLKCSLPFEDIARIIANHSKMNLTTHDVFHIIFQFSDPVPRGLCIEHYSFSNAVPLYYPRLTKSSEKAIGTEFEFCKELWYCLEQYNGLISFGIGRASWNSMGKSSLLDLIFETDFVKGSPQESAFHFGSIDIQMTKNLFGEVNVSSNESTNWAYIDCHSYSDIHVVQSMCSHLDVALIHVCCNDMKFHKTELDTELMRFDVKHEYIFIRDSDCNEIALSREIDNDRHRTMVCIPDLTRKDIMHHSIIKTLKQIGYEILHLNIQNRQNIDSHFIEKVLNDLNTILGRDIQMDKQLIQNITNYVDVTTKFSKTIYFGFLNFYPVFVEYMSLYHQACHETDRVVIDKLYTERQKLSEKLNSTSKGEIVIQFNDILQQENSTLILWKLSKELYNMSKQLIDQNLLGNTQVKEKKNDKYTLEILWREALLSQRYGNNVKCKRKGKDDFKAVLTSNFSKHVGCGEAFELIDGDNLRFFNKDIDELLSKFYEKSKDQKKSNKIDKIKRAPIVVSIFGPQNSGKSTLLNYCFGCKFLTSSGRCTRGIYGSLSKLDRLINLSDSFLILDTEGLDAIERDNIKDTSMIHFDRTMVLFCLAVSQVVIINVVGDIGSEMQNLLQICALSLNRLKVNKVKAPKIFFVLNQQADPDPNKHLDAINLLMEKLNSESFLLETEGLKLSDLIQVSRENLFILPSAFNFQQMSRPGAKLFDSNVIKLSPTIAFADKCSKLKLTIIDQLENMEYEDRSPHRTMSEWLEMAGVIWDTIIKYQDIVKFKNVEELMCKNKLNKVVSNLMEKHMYNNQNLFAKEADDICKEIDQYESHESLSDTKNIFSQKSEKFDDYFVRNQDLCMREFSEICQKDTLLKRFDYICSETHSNILRLIYVVKKTYKDQIERKINTVLTEMKISQSMKGFQEAIIQNVDKYLEYKEEEKKYAFEVTWCKTFGSEDGMGEMSEREESFSSLYSIFRMEYNSMENKQDIYNLFSDRKFNMDVIIEEIRNDIIHRFCQPCKFEQSEKLTYTLSGYHTPIKEMVPYNGGTKYTYLSKDSLYRIDDPWYSKLLSTDVKLDPAKWVPDNCHDLIHHCSGYESLPDINWNPNMNKQTALLLSKLRTPNDSKELTWEKFIDDITFGVLELLKMHSEVNHGVVSKIIHELCFRIKLINHEIGFIQTGLSNIAERVLSTYVFSLVFQFLWQKKTKIQQQNKLKKETRKEELLRYFLQKIENRKMVRGSWNRNTMAESDANFSQKYARDYIESVKRELIVLEEINLKTLLEDRKETLSHDSILSLAENRVGEELLKNNGEEVTDTENLVVQYICNRSKVLNQIFEKEWKELATTLYATTSRSINNAFRKKTERIKFVVKSLLSELEHILHRMESHNGFDSDSNFEHFEMNAHNFPIAREIPFKAMNHYLEMYLNPIIKPEAFKRYFSHTFKVNGLKLKASDTYVLCNKPSEPMLDADTFKKLVNTEMFNITELIFNLYTYIKHFDHVLQNTTIQLTRDDFAEMIKSSKEEFEKNMIGCPSQCPSCGKFCDREIHTNNGRCQIKIGHQISSMGGKVWNTDNEKTAVLYMCDHYKDNTQVLLQNDSIQWGEFKDRCKEWNWSLPQEEKYINKQNSNQERMKKIWNKFGRGILNYYFEKDGTKITFVPYTTHEEVNKPLASVKYNICFVIDGTGSMAKDIYQAKNSVGQLIAQFASRGNSSEFRVVIYRDHCDAKIIETFPSETNFTPQQRSIQDFLRFVRAGGGGDDPEAVLDGLATAAIHSDWNRNPWIKNKIIHIFDAPPHGDFPDYKSHSENSNKIHCCCCNHGTICKFDWDRDVWHMFRKLNIEYHGINTSISYPDYESTMREELALLCGDFQVVGKEVVNDAILEIFVDFKIPTQVN